MLYKYCWDHRVAWSILWALGAWDSGSNPGGPTLYLPDLAQFGRALDCRSKCCWFKSGSRDFIIISILSYWFLFWNLIFWISIYFKVRYVETFIYNNKYIILMSIIYTHIVCPGGVGAIMWACRARDSGSNPGQGA